MAPAWLCVLVLLVAVGLRGGELLWGVKGSYVPVEGSFLKILSQPLTPTSPQFSTSSPPPLLSQPPWGDNYLSQVLSTGALPTALASCSTAPERGAEQPKGPGHCVNTPALPRGTTHPPALPSGPQTAMPQRGLDKTAHLGMSQAGGDLRPGRHRPESHAAWSTGPRNAQPLRWSTLRGQTAG